MCFPKPPWHISNRIVADSHITFFKPKIIHVPWSWESSSHFFFKTLQHICNTMIKCINLPLYDILETENHPAVFLKLYGTYATPWWNVSIFQTTFLILKMKVLQVFFLKTLRYIRNTMIKCINLSYNILDSEDVNHPGVFLKLCGT
jgi:hypothetical protein